MHDTLARLAEAHRPINQQKEPAMKRRLSILVSTFVSTLVFALFASASPGRAATLLWTNAATDNAADNPANWYDTAAMTYGHTPGSGDDILLDSTFSDGTGAGTNADLSWGSTATSTVDNWTQQNYSGTVTIGTTYAAFDPTFTVFTVSNNLTLNDGVWTHTKNTKGYNQADRDEYRLRVDVVNDFTLGTNADIDVSSQGYIKAQPGYNGGGTHGGWGGGNEHGKIDIYDSAFTPILHGEGSGTTGGSAPQDGGGSVYIDVTGQTIVDGDIIANVLPGGTYTRSAAGGSVYLETGSISGAGTIQARGQDSAGGSNTGNGGGGRVAVKLTDVGEDFSAFSGSVDARAGSGGSFDNKGAAGTVYLQDGSQTDGTGELRIDFVNLYGDMIDDYATHLTSEDFSSTSLNLVRQAKLQIKSGKSNIVGSLAGDSSSNLTIDSGQTLTAGGNNRDTIFNGALHGGGNLTKTGTGTLALNGDGNDGVTPAYTGTTTISDGTLVVGHDRALGTGEVVLDGGTLHVANGFTASNPITANTGTISGSGTLTSALTIGAGVVLSPGDSPETLTTGAETWADGGVYLWEINDALGVAGNDPGWDVLLVNGLLDITATGGGFTIAVVSLTASNTLGDAAGFGGIGSFEFLIAESTETIGSFSPTQFTLDTDDFTNVGRTVTWDIVRGDAIGQLDNQLYLVYTNIPEPTSFLLLALAGLAGLRRRHI